MSQMVIRALLRLVMLVAVAATFLPVPGFAADGGDDEALIFFWGDGCPHCAREHEFLSELAAEFPDLEILQYEVWNDEANREVFVQTMAALGMEPRAVPTTIFGERVWEGFDDSFGDQIRAAVSAAYTIDDEAAPPAEEEASSVPADTVDVPLIGEVTVASDSLVASTLAIGFVDGFNPCSLWVLSMLLALVLHTGSRRRVMAVGSVFLVVTTALYGLYIIGVYSVLSYVAYVTWVRVVVALLALTFGLINLKDFAWFGRGPSLTIPERRKAGLYAKMRRAAAADRPLPQVLGGTAALAVGVSLIETPCTAGFPIMWANLLSDAGVGFGAAAVLFTIYMAVFLLDELAILGVAVVAMRVTKVQERHGRILKLVGGMVMVTLAAVLLVAPGMMETVGGALGVFGIAAALCAVALVIDHIVRRNAAQPTRRRVSSH